mmetsp:Transcript_16614/g.26977  ORF Transcript_16614/g.26977 Transcript_16614/m.26977 type:complete len:107 (-) Transcript_16614:151-471(-)
MGLDAGALGAFADGCGVRGLREALGPLEALCRALRDPDLLVALADPARRARTYPQVDPSKMVLLLEKYEGLGMLAKIKQQGGRQDLPQFEKKDIQNLIKELKNQGF